MGSSPVKATFERAVMSERKIDIYNHVMPLAVADRIRELAPGKGDMVKRTLLHGSAVRRGLDGVSGTPFLTLGSHRAIQSQPRPSSSYPEAAAQSDELGCL
jgi:hypothetical protein